MAVYVSPALDLQNLLRRRIQYGEFRLHQHWTTYAVVTNAGSLYLLRVEVPHGSLISITRDPTRKFGLPYRIRASSIKVRRITDVRRDKDLDNVTVKRMELELDRTYNDFDFVRHTFFVCPNYLEARRLTTYMERYGDF